MIARDTGTNQVLPAVLPSLASGYHMVKREVASPFVAILTGETVSCKHLSPGELPGCKVPFHQMPKAYDRRDGDGYGGSMHLTAAIGQELCLALTQQHNCAAHVANVDGDVVQVEDQNGTVKHSYLQLPL